MKQYKFKATIQPCIGGGAGVIFPYDVEREFGTRGKVPVKATFDAVPYTGSLIKCGPANHMLGLLKAIREQIGKGPGDTVSVVVVRDESMRTVDVPPELQKLLKKEGLLPVFEKLSYTHRREYCRWITEAKKEETRQARLAKAVTMLRDGVKTPG
jgi:Bacteriocin-protection, YdeI or OmpD-Associated/Domain of unknown function (DUF1905)